MNYDLIACLGCATVYLKALTDCDKRNDGYFECKVCDKSSVAVFAGSPAKELMKE